MKYISQYLLVFLISLSVYGFENHVGSNGVTGLTITPTANIDSGVFRLQYMDRNIGIQRSDGFNFSSTFGLADFLEIGGRLSANTWNTNLFTEDTSGVRDLSASAKLQINPLFNLQDFPLKTSLGVIDYGGAAALYRSNYLASTLNVDSWQISAGYSNALTTGAYNPLSGTFASISNQFTSWLNLRAEQSDKKTWAGMSLSDSKLMKYLKAPIGSRVFINFDQQMRGENLNGKRPIMAFGIQLPLDGSINPYTKRDLLIDHETHKKNQSIMIRAKQTYYLKGKKTQSALFKRQVFS